MKRILSIALPFLVLAIAAPAFAGEGKCTAGTQECLDYMAQKMKNKGWIGVELENTDAGLKITAVVEGSPAEAAGLSAGDYLVAVNGIEYSEANHEKLGEMQKTMTPGSEFTFSIRHGEKNKDLAITLGTMPEDVYAQMIGGHMIEHATMEAEEE